MDDQSRNQWKSIEKAIHKRNDIIPFGFGRNFTVTIGEHNFKVYSKRDFFKKMDMYADDNTEFSLDFMLNFTKLVETVEEKVDYYFYGEENGEDSK